jgi:hypothetical protein
MDLVHNIQTSQPQQLPRPLEVSVQQDSVLPPEIVMTVAGEPKSHSTVENTEVQHIRRQGGLDPVRRDDFLPHYQHPPPHAAGTKRNSKSGRSRNQAGPRVIEMTHTV